MLLRGSDRPFRPAPAARLSIICALALALAIAIAQPASAFERCPATGGPHQFMERWKTYWPEAEEGTFMWDLEVESGVTICGGGFGDTEPEELAFVQIVDLADGAKLRLHSERDGGQPTPPSDAHWKFMRRLVLEWNDWIHANSIVPDPFYLMSTTNASFFMDTESPTTMLSLPEKSSAFVRTLGGTHGTDPAWDALKRYLYIGPPDTGGTQRVEIGSFPTHYTSEDVYETFEGAYDGLVAFEPLYLVPGSDREARRTMVGVAGSKVYILTTHQPYTLEQAQQILQHFNPAVTSIQLDGGGSTQMDSPWDAWINSFVRRHVPDTLAVYADEFLGAPSSLAGDSMAEQIRGTAEK